MSRAGPGYIHTLTKDLGLCVSTEEMKSAYKMLIGNLERKCRRGLLRKAAEFISLQSLQLFIQ
jgi:hypothetical protein